MSRVRGGQASQFLAHRLAGLLQRHRRLEPEFSQPVATAAVGSGDLVALALGAVGTRVVPGLVGLDRKSVRRYIEAATDSALDRGAAGR